MTCYTTYGQYKFAVESGRVDDLRLVRPKFPIVEVTFRFRIFGDKLHLHCPGRGEWKTRMEGVFDDMRVAKSQLVSHERLYWCKHCDRGPFFSPDCQHLPPRSLRDIVYLQENNHVSYTGCRRHPRID
jgi:hypothetical protein